MERTELSVSSGQTSLRMVAYDGPGPGGSTVVVLHGLPVSIDIMTAAVPGHEPYARIAREGFNVLAVDWPGHGRSGGRRGHLTYRSALDAAAAAVDTAADRYGGPVALLGSSLGGPLAFYAALEDTRVSAVACAGLVDLRAIGPTLQRAHRRALVPLVARLASLSGGMAARVSLPLPVVLPPSDLAEAPQLSRALRRHPQSVRAYDLAGLASILLSPQDKPDVGAQRTPTFVAVGSRDLLLPETAARAVVSRLTSPHELWVLPGAGHQLLLEHPEALIPQMARFLRLHLGAASAQAGQE